MVRVWYLIRTMEVKNLMHISDSLIIVSALILKVMYYGAREPK